MEKFIAGYEGLYSVDTEGNVFSHRYGKKKKLSGGNARGYLFVGLCKNGKRKTHLIHRLVGHAFLPNPDNLPEINHKNGIKTDNRSVNLEWVTISENMRHAYKLGLRPPMTNETKRKIGEAVRKARSRAVVQLDKKTGEYIASYSSCTEAGISISGQISAISAVCSRKRKSAYGYKWKYENEISESDTL